MCIYEAMKAMCPFAYNHNGFMAMWQLEHMMYDYLLVVPINQKRVPTIYASSRI